MSRKYSKGNPAQDTFLKIWTKKRGRMQKQLDHYLGNGIENLIFSFNYKSN